mgnify:CR=1 FL=1|tara:strand:+ start:1498 stop:1719 length:222 start_codon:yes stop_codon:yes gene_type:complete
MKTLWQTDKTDKHGYPPSPNICDCAYPILKVDLIIRTKAKLPKYKCGKCLSWNQNKAVHTTIYERETNISRGY